MKRLFFVLLPVFALLGSCRNTGIEIPVDADEKEVEIVLRAPEMVTRAAISDENLIGRLEVLVFQGEGDEATFLYRRYAWPKSGSSTGYRTTLKLGKDLSIFFVANAGDILDNAPAGILDEAKATKWSVVREALLLDSPKDLKAGKLPMWGQLTGQTIEDKEVNNLGSVTLLRSVASADFDLAPAVGNFELEALYLVYAADRGYLPYDPAKVTGSPGNLSVTAPWSPSSMVTDVDWEKKVGTGERAVENVFYMFDNDTPLPAGGTNRQTKLVMKGTWTDAEGCGYPTYYPIAFREETGNSGEYKRLMATRNHKYLITVTKVNGDGFDTLEDAKEGEEINLDYKVVPWDEYEDEEIIIEGNQFVSLETRRVNVWRGVPTQGTIGMSTSYSREDIRMSTDKNVPGEEGVYSLRLKDEEYDGAEFCTVTLTENGGRFTFTFRTLVSFPILDRDVYRQGKVYVKAGRVSFTLTVRQHNMSLNDWELDGEYEWP